MDEELKNKLDAVLHAIRQLGFVMEMNLPKERIGKWNFEQITKICDAGLEGKPVDKTGW